MSLSHSEGTVPARGGTPAQSCLGCSHWSDWVFVVALLVPSPNTFVSFPAKLLESHSPLSWAPQKDGFRYVCQGCEAKELGTFCFISSQGCIAEQQPQPLF